MPSITEFTIVFLCIAKAALLVAASASGLYLTGRAATAMFGRRQAPDATWHPAQRRRSRLTRRR